MLPLQIGEIALACKGEAHGEAQVTSVCIDSRKISQGCLFIAIKGDRFDGHDFVEKAFEEYLHGNDGKRLITTDENGKITGLF